ncbi:Triple Functional Domain Protein [Manis pentadactyla]|nr:Triple Functional Domain Protein [Manis pentadactyla]
MGGAEPRRRRERVPRRPDNTCFPGPPRSLASELDWFRPRLPRAPLGWAPSPARPRRLPVSAEGAVSERAPTVYTVSLSPQGESAADARLHQEAGPSGVSPGCTASGARASTSEPESALLRAKRLCERPGARAYPAVLVSTGRSFPFQSPG